MHTTILLGWLPADSLGVHRTNPVSWGGGGAFVVSNVIKPTTPNTPLTPQCIYVFDPV